MIHFARRETFFVAQLPVYPVASPVDFTGRDNSNHERATRIHAEIDPVARDDPLFLDFIVGSGIMSREKRKPTKHNSR